MTLEKDAERIAAAIEENFAGGTEPGVRATVQSDKMSPKSIPAGAGRPLFINYYIHIEDGKRKAVLNMGQAGVLRDEIESDWDVDRLFDAIRGRDVEIEDVG